MSGAPNAARVRIADVLDDGGRTNRIIELNRPDKLNCLSLEMLDGLLLALEGTDADRIIMTGAGRAFCTGLDLAEIGGVEGGAEHLRKLIAIYRLILVTRRHTVVLAGGYAVGGGAGLVACAQSVVVSGDFCFRLPGGGLSRLAAVVLPVCTMRTAGRVPDTMNWLGCDVQAAQARKFGLVDRIVSAWEMSVLIESIRNGRGMPKFIQPVGRPEHAISKALAGLDEFLRAL